MSSLAAMARSGTPSRSSGPSGFGFVSEACVTVSASGSSVPAPGVAAPVAPPSASYSSYQIPVPTLPDIHSLRPQPVVNPNSQASLPSLIVNPAVTLGVPYLQT